jgi:hypothetical protein
MIPGIYPDMLEADYRASDAVSCSILKRFADAPAKAHVSIPNTAAMSAGRLIHSVVLEPHAFYARYAVTDLDRRGTKAWNEEEAEAASDGRQLLKRDDYDMAQRVRDAVMAHPTAGNLLTSALIPEASVFWRDAETDLLCRSRVDGVNRRQRLLLDVKTTTDASPDEFSRSAAKFRHHWQAAFYRSGITAAPGGFQPEAFFFIAVEREAPYLVAVYELSRTAMMQGERDVREALREYAQCKASGIWPGYSDGPVLLDLPAWAMDEEFIA